MSTTPSEPFNQFNQGPLGSNPGASSSGSAVADLYVFQGEASSSVEKIALKFGEAFMVLDTRGDLPESEQETGLYWRGTRFLRSFDLFLDGKPMTGLSHSVSDEEGTCQIDLTNPYLPRDESRDFEPTGAMVNAAPEAAVTDSFAQSVPHGVAHVRRRLALRGRLLTEYITLTNFNETPVSLTLGLLAAAEFKDIFEIRGMHCAQHGHVTEPRLAADGMTLGYMGADEIQRETRIEFDPPAAEVGPAQGADGKRRPGAGAALWRFTLRPGAQVSLRATVRLWEGAPSTPVELRWPAIEPGQEEALRPRQLPALVSDNTFFNRVLMRGMHDLVMMCVRTPQGLFPYGGIPWYVAPFGRDSLITSLEFLPWFPEVARGTLDFLAARQGQKEDSFTEEQPGKILHELRRGELANLREIPFIPYYGTVDATPLFIIALEHYIRWTDDTEFLRRMWPHALAAARWMVEYGDRDGDGFLEYHRSASTGLVNQGWKDSWDSISHEDGSLAEGPIALCEAQAYAYAAFHSIAWLAERSGHGDQSDAWRSRATRLRQRFIDQFWWPEQQCYYLALDGDKEPCKVVNSNSGHCLWAGIATPEQGEAVVERLMRSDMYTEWGIRTLSSQARRYNPMSYHNGSVWPHDTAIIGAGFARYGFREEAARLLGNLYGVSLHYEGARLPELFCGFSRLHGYGPTRYPVACSPQSWAAGAPFLLISAILGFEPEAAQGRLTLRHPTLPEWLSRMEMRGLRVGGLNGRLRFDRAGSETAVVLSQYSEIDIHVVPS
ncbi:MAG TPA: glycogen debranching N-terminal domain-containing protein [Ktedonobacterales bacterium]|nr:glycogen debranching N-terminal domain-containing protein [Ktedonobacterales bacterium]